MLFYTLAISIFALVSQVKGHAVDDSSTWSGWGEGFTNRRWASQNRDISTANVKTLSNHCKPVHYASGGISATPVISGNVAYYPTWGGLLVAFDYNKCKTVWTVNVSSVVESIAPVTPLQQASLGGPASRTSPQIDGDVLYFGTLVNALIVAINKNTGHVLGMTQVNPHEVAMVTMSPTVYNGKIFVGASSMEEGAATVPGYVCCSFVGNVAAFSFDKVHNNFTTLWDIPMIPDAQAEAGWAGVAVWGSQPPIDVTRNQVIFGTCNTYTYPEVRIQWQNETAKIPAVAQGLVSDSCLPKDIMQESVIAVDIDLGIVNWVHQLPTLDAWTVACGFQGGSGKESFANCPEMVGPDADFGMAPAFIPGSANTPYGKDTIVIGQKNGDLYAMSAQAGQLFWTTMTSPDGMSGGLSWGIAVDDHSVYYTAINSNGGAWTIEPSGQTTNSSAYGAASLTTGKILWGVPVPDGGISYGPPSVVGDVILVAKTGTNESSLVAVQKITGKILDTWPVDGTFRGGVAIQDNSVIFGTGYGGITAPTQAGGMNVLSV
ncbi:hypothetical protein B7463_g4730, partial [Scytalidium lignicola]